MIVDTGTLIGVPSAVGGAQTTMIVDPETLIGVPFATGGRDPGAGLDCWGLVKHVLTRVGRPVLQDWYPKSTEEAIEIFLEQELSGDWEPVAWSPWLVVGMGTKTRLHHVGVSLPGHRVLHATEGHGVVRDHMMALQHWFGRVQCYRSIAWD